MNNEELVKQHHPEAICIGPTKIFWPGQGERTRFMILLAPHMSVIFAEGETAEEAWANAAQIVQSIGG